MAKASAHHHCHVAVMDYWGLLLTMVQAFGASADEVGGKLRSVIQAHDPGAQVSAPERSPVSGCFRRRSTACPAMSARTETVALRVAIEFGVLVVSGCRLSVLQEVS